MYMSYNTELQANNADLQEILDTVNALPEAGDVELPELSNPGTAENLEQGYELIDADGNVITGNVPVARGGVNVEATSVTYVPMGDQSVVKLSATVSEKTILDPDLGGAVHLTALYSEFGDAAAADVAKGKTFTSAAGLLVTGTKEENDGARTVSVTVNAALTVYYFDADKVLQSLLGSATVEALNGVFYFYRTASNALVCTGDYTVQLIGASYYIAMFLGDTGSLTIGSSSGSGGS